VLRVPVSCRLSTVGVRFLGHPAPAEELSLPHGRPTGGVAAGPHRGCRVAHDQAAIGQGACFTPGTVVRSRPATILRPAPAALPRPVPTAPLEHPTGGGHSHEASTQVHSFAHHPRRLAAVRGPGTPKQVPADLLLARRPRVEQGPLRLRPRASDPAVTGDARRGGDRPSRTGPGTTPSISPSVEPPTVPPTCTHAPSHRT